MSDPKCRGRQRSAESECAILTATLQLLEQKPLRDITIEAIAQKAGVGKATIYKWWPSKAYVALDSVLTRMEAAVAAPDTGSAKVDFTEQLKSLIRFYTSPAGRIFCQFIAEGQSDPEFAKLFRERFLAPRRDAVRVIWQRGVERGEVRREIDSELVLDLIYGPTIFRLLAGHAPLNDAEAANIVAAVFAGIEKRPAE
ncbi:MAG TPA: TetR/AcrR family transcriptional regulator [Bryobacteraceae bacterium]|nr:TetR/AcrR family transcriptional regulator [Bryobacteraceae bacterium]